MKAIPRTDRQAVKAAVKEMYALNEKDAEDIMHQVLANVLYTLSRSFGFGKKRMRLFVDAVKDTDLMMRTAKRFDGTPVKWNAKDNVEYIKNAYDIDLEKEFRIEVEYAGSENNK